MRGRVGEDQNEIKGVIIRTVLKNVLLKLIRRGGNTSSYSVHSISSDTSKLGISRTASVMKYRQRLRPDFYMQINTHDGDIC